MRWMALVEDGGAMRSNNSWAPNDTDLLYPAWASHTQIALLSGALFFVCVCVCGPWVFVSLAESVY